MKILLPLILLFLSSPPQTTPTITWPVPATVVPTGTVLGPTQLNATASANGQPVAGTFTYTPAAGVKLTNVGTVILNTVFVPTDNQHFTSAKASVPLVVVRTAVSTFPALCTTFSDLTFTCVATGPVTPVTSVVSFVEDWCATLDGPAKITCLMESLAPTSGATK